MFQFKHHHIRLTPLRRPERAFQHFLLKNIVPVQKAEVFSCRLLHSSISGRSCPASFLIHQYSDPAVLFLKIPQNFHRPICRCVIDTNQLKVRKSLLLYTPQTFFQIFPCIIQRHDNRYTYHKNLRSQTFIRRLQNF